LGSLGDLVALAQDVADVSASQMVLASCFAKSFLCASVGVVVVGVIDEVAKVHIKFQSRDELEVQFPTNHRAVPAK